jgi:DNA primase
VAASLEIIQRIGPCNAKIQVKQIEDVRVSKRQFVIDRAKDLLKGLMDSVMPDSQELADEVSYSVRVMEIREYGKDRLPAGPAIDESDEVILVEGRADVLNLLKHGFKNVISMNGTSIPETIIELSRQKTITVFVDGDRGGDLIIKELGGVAEIDFVTKAPDGKEVEELTKKEIFKALREKVPAGQFKFDKRPAGLPPRHRNQEKVREIREERMGGRDDRRDRDVPRPPVTVPVRDDMHRDRHGPKILQSRPLRLRKEQKDKFKKMLSDLVGTRAACILDSRDELLGKVPVTELINTLRTIDNPSTIIFDGKVDHRLNGVAVEKGVKYLVGMEKEDIRSPVTILCRKDLE